MKNDIKYEIIEHIATLSTSESGWSKEVNKVSWNDVEPVIDIRNWNEEHTRCVIYQVTYCFLDFFLCYFTFP